MQPISKFLSGDAADDFRRNPGSHTRTPYFVKCRTLHRRNVPPTTDTSRFPSGLADRYQTTGVICRTIIAQGSPPKVSQGSPGKVYQSQIVDQGVGGTDEPT
jgi:hypothetical protein